jgi:hypothetical protein
MNQTTSEWLVLKCPSMAGFDLPGDSFEPTLRARRFNYPYKPASIEILTKKLKKVLPPHGESPFSLSACLETRTSA